MTIWSAPPPGKQALMPETAKVSNIDLRAVRLWLLAAAAMIFLTLIVGGATRLTESGLSIVEWKPITVVLPPFSETAWQAEFAKYQTIPQYQELNRGMNLDAFKVIYWWEWSHRLLARLTGVVFLLPFLFFLWRGAIPANLRARVTLLYPAQLGLALAHQVLAILVLTITVVHAERLSHHAIIYAQHAKPAEQGP